jgi:hypothetical protein
VKPRLEKNHPSPFPPCDLRSAAQERRRKIAAESPLPQGERGGTSGSLALSAPWLSPPSKSAVSSPHLVHLRGALMRRHDQRDGVRRPRVLSQQGTRAAPELPPGPLGVPARSWLKDRSARLSVTDRTKAGPAAVIAVTGAPRGARAIPQGSRATSLRFSARHPPLGARSLTRAGRILRRGNKLFALAPSFVMPGLDPGIHAVTPQGVDAPMEWIAGSSPAMTKKRSRGEAMKLARPTLQISRLRRREISAH